MQDDIRPPGTVQVRCAGRGCRVHFWVDPLDPRLPDGPFYCSEAPGQDPQACWPEGKG